ncbi:uncharacterized protein LOC131233378 [Magnolia sinica]|uniref:uncharacterized protein LOC131233378 n=1 Tax=Magnolia sinica TaxID=86752 RepID=UPI00265803E7|nr:uncharacterized protein LOC131233378 [Magnolia sinica]
MYLHGIETRFNREDRNADEGQEHEQGLISVFAHNVRPLGSPTFQDMDLGDLAKARWYVLHNCEEIESYLDEHIDEMKSKFPTNYDRMHQDQFPEWFAKRVRFHIVSHHT